MEGYHGESPNDPADYDRDTADRSFREGLPQAIKRLGAIGKRLKSAILGYPERDVKEMWREAQRRAADRQGKS